MAGPDASFASRGKSTFVFRPWVRRAGLSILVVSAAVTALLVGGATIHPSLRFGWAREPFVWAYIGALWVGGAKVFVGTFVPIAEIDEEQLILRPLHQIGARRIRWEAILGTEQMIGGDRLILYYATPRGMRFVALNLNLVKGRRELLGLLDARLRDMGFVERTVDRSRYLSRPA